MDFKTLSNAGPTCYFHAGNFISRSCIVSEAFMLLDENRLEEAGELYISFYIELEFDLIGER